MNQTLLLTGGAGFIGTKLYSALVDQFSKIVIVDNFSEEVHPNGLQFQLLRSGDALAIADVSDSTEVNRIINEHQPTAVVHLAAETATGKSLHEPAKHVRTNVLGTAVLLEALAAQPKKVDAFVVASTRAVYGEGSWTNSLSGKVFMPRQRSESALKRGQWNFVDSSPNPMVAGSVAPNPVNIYGVTKNAQEQILSTWCESMGVSFIALRLQNVYGPGQTIGNSYTGVLTHFADLASRGQSLPVFEDGQILRDFVYIKDVVASLAAAVSKALESHHNTVLDIGSGTPKTLLEVANLIAANYPNTDVNVTGSFRLGDVRHAFADVSAARTVLNWEPKVDLETGISQLCSHVSSKLNR